MKELSELDRAFCALLKPGRLAKGYTQEQAAEAVSKTLRWYQMVEKGLQAPGREMVIRLEILFDLDVQSLREKAGLITPALSTRQQAKRRKASRREKSAVSPGEGLRKPQVPAQDSDNFRLF